jgi:UDPglucose 6-dehydrogenase
MNPEFLRQRTAEDDFRRPWLTVFGTVGEREASLLQSLYEPFEAPIIATDVTTAEVIQVRAQPLQRDEDFVLQRVPPGV